METMTHIGLDVHKETIAVAVAVDGSRKVEYRGNIANDERAVRKLVSGFCKTEGTKQFYYEAGPCGYELYRYLTKLNHKCTVVAPSLIPRKAGDKVKTDRRDAEQLARLGRAGELTAVAVPTEKIEHLREVVRAREDAVSATRRARQNLLSFLLRHGKKYPGKSTRTQSFYVWVDKIKFESPELNLVLQDYVDAVRGGDARVVSLNEQLNWCAQRDEFRSVVQALLALRGIDVVSAVGIIAEAGDLRRFHTARQFMSYLGLTPSEYSSGQTERRGSITKSGNSHLRRILVESAWCARHAPRKTAHWKTKAQHASPAVQAIAWKATARLHRRYVRLVFKGKPRNKVVVAVARELAGFVWAVAQQAYRESEVRM